MVSLRLPQGLNCLQQVLPLALQRCPSLRISGLETGCLEIQGRRRKPSQRSVRGSSATRCLRCSLVRGTVDNGGRWWWVRVIRNFGQIASRTTADGSKVGLNFGTTRMMRSIEVSSLTIAMGRRCSCFSKIVHLTMVSRLGRLSNLLVASFASHAIYSFLAFM